MSISKSRLWLVGTALVCVVLVLAGWFLLIAPKRAEAAELRSQSESAAALNEQLEVRIAQLRLDDAELPQRKAELAAIKNAMPADAQLSKLTLDLQALAAESGVTLMSIQPGTVSPLLTTPEAAAAAPAAGTDAAAGATTPAAPTSDLSAMPVGIVVVGNFDKAEAFLQALQDDLDRRYLVDGINVVAEEPAEAAGGKPAVTIGDVTLTLTGRVFVLTTAAAPAAPADAAADATGATAGNN